MQIELKPFQVRAAQQIADRYAFFAGHSYRPTYKGKLPRPFYQALSAITGAGKTPVLAEAVTLMRMYMEVEPIVFWMSKAKSVVQQTYTNFSGGGKYAEIVDDFRVIRAGQLEPNLIADGSSPLIVLATTGLFNNKEQADGALNIYKKDQDLFGNQSPWDRLIARDAGGVRRPLIIVYDEGHNLSEQQTHILAELEPEAYLLASATLKLPANFAKMVLAPQESWVEEASEDASSVQRFAQLRAVDEKGAPDANAFAITSVDSNAVIKGELIKTSIQFDGTTAPMERCLDDLYGRLQLIEQEIHARTLGFRPKAIYVCKTNITDDGDKDDHTKPFEHRNAPPIRIWRYLVEQKKVDPAKVAIYADLKFSEGNKPEAVNLFSRGESDFDEFQAGDFQHIIFNQGLQEGWDDPACYLGYIDKSMGSQIKVEQIIGRVLRQYDAKHYDSPLLNSAHFFLRVDKKNVFTESIEAVRAKLQESGAAIEIVHTYGGGDGGSEDLKPKGDVSVVLHQVHADADDAMGAIAQLVTKFPTFKEGEVDTQGDAHSKTETVDISDLGKESGHDWTASGHANRVRLRWLVSNAIRGRSRAALAVVDLKASKFDVRVEAGSNAAAAADSLAREVVSAYYQLTSLVYESELEFTFSTIRIPKKAQAFDNGLYARYAGLNKFETPFAAALDKAGFTWHRNPSNGGFRIPLLSEGDSASFSPDFLVWKGKLVFCLDTKGAHLLTDAVARKLFDIQDEGTTKILTRFISEGKQTTIGGKAIKSGYTVWKMKNGSPTPIHVLNLDQAVKECLKL
ncbi:DEAD/DEAH box helicase family protein [Xanthomonas campestris pv. campestris]|uniref:DEAD/DEAH box helicase family protein n=1 Tax=Xanthomonas campestris TaxID=339 RepID=UPI001F28F3A6|nr:DEAD/DEAH box helicase family protein [Xanthomonas campestris]MCF8839703.1 DEAD/DEAH box helicase family protein [Xanthomonas campestris pv. campestris]MDO0882881.1 DEAD/DEAH box helicase family protein [Xanthomonas campestris pv. campestris]MEA0635307.1 DEAD/DEAH box helicase family protein [Xanthomonas campestris pv. campestris]MEA0651695.1 DEAD/DEAH box helicase family protein [Xanthomonas campestris pv. campestris]MEA0655779.1 DEAD/DEAH box helicase family protein [Xanthomonas campestri